MTKKKPIDTSQLTPLPDPPPREPDESTVFIHFFDRGNNEYLAVHLGNRDTTLITGGCQVMPTAADHDGAIRPDVLIAFHANIAAYRAREHYVIDEQGKPPDFVLEIASESTATEDTGPKRVEYAALGIPEYWRFDHTGAHHGAKLAGDRLADNRYQSIPIEELPGNRHRGYSPALNLTLEWHDGNLNWIDPDTGQPILTREQDRQNHLSERQARLAAEARVRELEHRLEPGEATGP